jgi:hypothetical protein
VIRIKRYLTLSNLSERNKLNKKTELRFLSKMAYNSPIQITKILKKKLFDCIEIYLRNNRWNSDYHLRQFIVKMLTGNEEQIKEIMGKEKVINFIMKIRKG